MNLDGVVYMVESEDGLTPKQWKKIMSFFETQEELIPIEASENNTTMYGLVKNECYDELEQIVKELEVICDDWSKQPENGLLHLNINNKTISIAILCDYETVIIK